MTRIVLLSIFLTSCSSELTTGADAAGVDAVDLPDGFGPVTAEFLGQPCAETGTCPDGYTCVKKDPGDAMGYCSLPCAGLDDDAVCTNLFPGPGAARCEIPVGGGYYCGILCGTQWIPPLPTDCPAGLTCTDWTGPAGTPDGMTDTCWP